MRFIVAPDSYKGSISAIGVAEAMEQGIKAVFPAAEVLKAPIADGGEGTVVALVEITGGEIITQEVIGPLGDPLQAHWGILGDKETAVIEMAAASGLPLVPKDRLDPRITTTYGTGQLMHAALDRGVKKIIIGIGGSATNDGGMGMAKALGARFFDHNGNELPEGGAALKNLARVDILGLDPRLAGTEILVACDVDNPLCGPRGASAVYGPQKGATPEMIVELDAALAVFAERATEATGKEVAELPGAGAAGGLGAGLMFFSNAQLRPGVEIVLEAAGFSDMAAKADLVFTGEGRTDFQTAFGKAPVGVAKVAKQFGVPVVCLSGGLGPGAEHVLTEGIDAIFSVVPQPMPLDECMKEGPALVTKTAEQICRLLKIGMGLKR
ncbi:MAG: glycerate kinase [Firmicutes bacterium]|nr:glycerate kinase [Bacillota bacterium]